MNLLKITAYLWLFHGRWLKEEGLPRQIMFDQKRRRRRALCDQSLIAGRDFLRRSAPPHLKRLRRNRPGSILFWPAAQGMLYNLAVRQCDYRRHQLIKGLAAWLSSPSCFGSAASVARCAARRVPLIHVASTGTNRLRKLRRQRRARPPAMREPLAVAASLVGPNAESL